MSGPIVVFFSSLLVLVAAGVVTERKRGHDWRTIAEGWAMFLLPPSLGGLAWVIPESRGIVRVALVLLIAWALLMMFIKKRRR